MSGSAGQFYATQSGDGPTGEVRIPMHPLRRACAKVLASAGLRQEAAELVADSMVDAEARGISSHGVVRTRIYAERLWAKLVDGDGEPRVERQGCTARVDAGNAIGHVGALAGCLVAAEGAREHGVGVAGVTNSNHCGTLSFFARKLTQRGLVAIAATNSPPTMSYFGGRTRAVGTNPVAFGIPTPEGPDIILDMATSATARGKIIYAARVGQGIPEGWAVDVDGRPTTDPLTALEGSVLPFAGPKGSGLAMIVELLCGAFLGGPVGPGIADMYEDWTRQQRVGHLFIALDPARWVGSASFADAIRDFVEYIRGLPPAEGSEGVLLPGEPESRKQARAAVEGVVISREVHTDLCSLLGQADEDPGPLMDAAVPA